MLTEGDVIVVPFFRHQENNNGEPRWVIVTEIVGDTFYVVPLTTQTRQERNYDKTILVKKKSSEGKMMGLKKNSLIMLDRQENFKFKWFPKFIIKGKCPEELLEEILDNL